MTALTVYALSQRSDARANARGSRQCHDSPGETSRRDRERPDTRRCRSRSTRSSACCSRPVRPASPRPTGRRHPPPGAAPVVRAQGAARPRCDCDGVLAGAPATRGGVARWDGTCVRAESEDAARARSRRWADPRRRTQPRRTAPRDRRREGSSCSLAGRDRTTYRVARPCTDAGLVQPGRSVDHHRRSARRSCLPRERWDAADDTAASRSRRSGDVHAAGRPDRRRRRTGRADVPAERRPGARHGRPRSVVKSVAVTPDERTLVTAGHNQVVRVWALRAGGRST